MAETLHQLFCERVRDTPGAPAYRQFDVRHQRWISHSWLQMQALVHRWHAALAREGLAAGARVALLVPNCVQHVALDLAALACGCVSVPLHVIDNPENLGYVVADCGASLLLVDHLERWEALAPLRSSLPALRRVLVLEPDARVAEEGLVRSVDRWLDDGESHVVAPVVVPAETLAAIVYTSGTTGRPKGVMLSHRNVLANVMAIQSRIPVRPDDLFLSFLPLSHTLERTVGYYLPMAAGACVAFARSTALLMQDLESIRPTVLVSVPRIYERAYTALGEKVRNRLLTRWLFQAAVHLGWRRFEFQQGRAAAPSAAARLAFARLDALFGDPLRQRFGGRLRAAVTGGAALPAELARCFLALGIPLLQGYGMTESSPVVAFNTPEDNDPQSVGRPVPGVEVRIGADQELLVRGENVMLGYWQRPEDTARARDSQGWLHTGDQAALRDGRVFIGGRIKDIIVTSTGEKISPTDIEAAILQDPLFDQVLVVGEGRPYLAALVVLNAARWEQQAPMLDVDPHSAADLNSYAATHWVLEHLASLLRRFPSYATPRAVCLSTAPWTVAAGLVTPTLKPKRSAIQARFALQIGQLYRGH